MSLIKPHALSTLLPFQRAALAAIARWCRGHLWASTGSGKTRLGLLWALQAPSLPVVVVTKSAARWQWRDEVQDLTTCECQILEGLDAGASQIQPGCRVYVIGYDTLVAWGPLLVPLLRRRGGFGLVLDEIHKAKSHKRWDARVDPANPMGRLKFLKKDNRAAAVMDLAYAASRCLGMTATPIPDRLRDLWAQLDLVQPRAWGTFYEFVHEYCDAREGDYGLYTGGVGSDAAIARLEQRLESIVYEVPAEAVSTEMPALRRRICRIPESEQVRALGSIAKDLKAAAKQSKIHFTEMKLMEAASRKRHALLERVEDDLEHSLKVIVFTGRRLDAHHLAETLGRQCKQCWCLTGEDAGEERNGMVKAYMAAKGPAVLVGTIGAIGESLNLQKTNKAYVAMIPWRPADVIQLEGRVCRIGGWPCEVVYLVAEGTYDERVVSILIGKLPVVDRLIGGNSLDLLTKDLRGGTDEELLAKMFARLTGSEP